MFALADSLIGHLTKTIGAAPLDSAPFDHVSVPQAFPPELYEKMMRALPATKFYGELQHADARVPDGHSARRKLELRPAPLRRLPAEQRELWNEIAAALNSPEVETAFKNRFTAALEKRFRRPPRELHFHPAAMLLRDLGGYKISIHCDSPR